MKKLITKSDGAPIKSKIHALQKLDKLGIDRNLIIEENGQFYYEEQNEPIAVEPEEINVKAVDVKTVTWETPVFDKNNERTKLFIPATDIEAVILGKHPAGQSRINKAAFEINIGDENFIMSLDLISKIFRVKE